MRLLLISFGMWCVVAECACGPASGGAPGAGGASNTGGAMASGGADGESGVRHVVLVGDYAQGTFGQGYDVRTGTVVEGGTANLKADFYLSMKMIISLFTPDATGGTFCLKGLDLQRVADVPPDPTGCTWGLADLGGNAHHAESTHAGHGYLVRDRAGTLLGRVLIVTDTAGPGSHIEVAFDWLRN